MFLLIEILQFVSNFLSLPIKNHQHEQIIKPSKFISLCQRRSAGSILETLLLHVVTNFIILLYHIKDASVSLYTHLLCFHRMDRSH